ncbi:MAG: DNA topology modulation protein [Alphaproteobacteria bacterium]|nr:DNA topology modulation protein [Alphaproteobacteria bacterium]
MTPTRIMIFGPPGSGKSHFAKRLHLATGLPLFHLDKIFFKNGWIEEDTDVFLSKQRALVAGDHWIIDGNSVSSLEMRWQRADLVLYFHLPRLLCLARLIKRRFFKDRSIDDRAPSCPEVLRVRLIRYMWGFHGRVGPHVNALRNEYPLTPFHEITSIQEQNALLQDLIRDRTGQTS